MDEGFVNGPPKPEPKTSPMVVNPKRAATVQNERGSKPATIKAPCSPSLCTRPTTCSAVVREKPEPDPSYARAKGRAGNLLHPYPNR